MNKIQVTSRTYYALILVALVSIGALSVYAIRTYIPVIPSAPPFQISPASQTLILYAGQTTVTNWNVTTDTAKTGTFTVTVFPIPDVQNLTITPFKGSLVRGSNMIHVSIALSPNPGCPPYPQICSTIASDYFRLTPVWI